MSDNIKTLEFELNLNPEQNWMLTHWGLLCNPFECDGNMMRRQTIRGLASGIDRKSLNKFLPQIGLSKEVTKKIISKVRMHNKYKIKVTWDSIKERGSLEVRKLRPSKWESV
jgi:hypothetical protein